jgi:hypothetical protein
MKRQFSFLISLFTYLNLFAQITQTPLTVENKSFNGIEYIQYKGEYQNCYFAEARKKIALDTQLQKCIGRILSVPTCILKAYD